MLAAKIVIGTGCCGNAEGSTPDIIWGRFNVGVRGDGLKEKKKRSNYTKAGSGKRNSQRITSSLPPLELRV